MSEKPLHVQVAEALGCRPMWLPANEYIKRGEGWYCGCSEQCPCQWIPPVGGVAGGRVPLYDTDWSATGPLLEKYGISLVRADEHNPAKHLWTAGMGGAHGWDDGSIPGADDVVATSPLEAVCRLLIRKAGTL